MGGLSFSLSAVTSQQLWMFLFLADLFLLTCAAMYILVSYYRRLGKLKDVERTAYTKANEVLSQMEKTSATILEKVESRADEILTHSELFKKDLNQAFEHSLEESSQKYVVMLEDHSKRFVDDYENLRKSVKDQSLEKAAKAIDTIEEDIRKSLEDSKVVARDQMGVFLKKALEEVETFKEQELEKIDKEIDEFVLQLAKELLRMNLTPKDHKKLIINSLEKAKEHAEEVIGKIDELKQSLYNKRVDLDKKMGELFSYEMKEKMKAYSLQQQVNLNDPDSFGKFLTELRSYIKNLPVVTVVVASEQNEGLVDEASNWFMEAFGKNVLLDIQVDPALIGGAKIIFNDKEKDFSLLKKLNDMYSPEDLEKMIHEIRRGKQIPQEAPVKTNGKQPQPITTSVAA